MINLSVPTTYEEAYVREIIDLNLVNPRVKVTEMYGSMHHAVVGHLRPSSTVPKITLQELKTHTKILHKHGIKYNYVMNATITSGIEYSKEGRKSIVDFARSLIDAGVDSFTITVPYIIKLLKYNIPQISITSSICSEVNTLQKAKQFEEYGVDCIVIDRNINRNFKMLTKFRKHLNVDLKVLCTTPCIYNCTEAQYHSNFSSMLSTTQFEPNQKNNMKVSHTTISCSLKRLENMVEYVKSPWIRPEDMKYYEDVGVKYFKLDGRDRGSSYNLDVIRAYIFEKFEGNLLYLMKHLHSKTIEDIYIDDDTHIKVGIDNRKMDNFIKPFVEQKIDCTQTSCSECNYCKSVSEKVIVYDPEWIELAKLALANETQKIEAIDI